MFTQGFVTFHARAGTCHRCCYKKPPRPWLRLSRAPHRRLSRAGSSTSLVALGWYRRWHGLGDVIKPGEINQELLPRLLQNLLDCPDVTIRKSGHCRGTFGRLGSYRLHKDREAPTAAPALQGTGVMVQCTDKAAFPAARACSRLYPQQQRESPSCLNHQQGLGHLLPQAPRCSLISSVIHSVL